MEELVVRKVQSVHGCVVAFVRLDIVTVEAVLLKGIFARDLLVLVIFKTD